MRRMEQGLCGELPRCTSWLCKMGGLGRGEVTELCKIMTHMEREEADEGLTASPRPDVDTNPEQDQVLLLSQKLQNLLTQTAVEAQNLDGAGTTPGDKVTSIQSIWRYWMSRVALGQNTPALQNAES